MPTWFRGASQERDDACQEQLGACPSGSSFPTAASAGSRRSGKLKEEFQKPQKLEKTREGAEKH